MSAAGGAVNRVFLHLPDGDQADRRLRSRHMIRDSLRDLLMETRALTGERSLTVAVVASAGGEALLGDVEGIEAIVADPFVTIEHRDVADRAERAELLRGFGFGGVFGPSWPYDRDRDVSTDVKADGGGHDKRRTWWYIPFWQWRGEGAGFKLWRSDGETFFSPPPPDAPVVRRIVENMAACPPVIWINLDRAEGRRRHMERTFEAFNVVERRRIAAIDADAGSSSSLGRYRPPPILDAVLSLAGGDASDGNYRREARLAACSASHVLALKEYLERYPEAPHAVVMEDDVTLELSPLWRKPLWAYLGAACSSGRFDTVVQLGVIALEDVDLLSADEPVPRRDHWYSTVAYAIRKEHAASLVSRYFDPESGAVDLSGVPAEPSNAFHPENLIFGGAAAGSATTLPLFNYLGTESDIDPNNPINHAICRGKIRSFWLDRN